MKIVTAKMENRKVMLEEVEFDGRVLELLKLLKLNNYEEGETSEDGIVSPSNLTIFGDYSRVDRGSDLLPCALYKIHDIYAQKDDIIAFVGIENIVENKPPLTLKYLESTLVFPTEDNPEML